MLCPKLADWRPETKGLASENHPKQKTDDFGRSEKIKLIDGRSKANDTQVDQFLFSRKSRCMDLTKGNITWCGTVVG